MSAYLIEHLTPEQSGSYTTGPGCLLAFEFDLQGHLLLTTVHNKHVQDSSLRLWFSNEPAGTSIELFHPVLKCWNPIRKAVYRICLYVHEQPVVENNGYPVYYMKVEPGLYCLNALNLVNSVNGFYMEFDLHNPDAE